MKSSDPANHQLHRMPVSSPSQKLPRLQVNSHFVKAVSRVRRETTLNGEFVSNVPKRPKQGSTRQPKNSPSLADMDAHVPKNVGKARGVPRATKEVPNRTPHEARQRTSKEDVVVILHLQAKGAGTIGWTPTFPDIVVGGESMFR
jgi:hypothetical protein